MHDRRPKGRPSVCEDRPRRSSRSAIYPDARRTGTPSAQHSGRTQGARPRVGRTHPPGMQAEPSLPPARGLRFRRRLGRELDDDEHGSEQHQRGEAPPQHHDPVLIAGEERSGAGQPLNANQMSTGPRRWIPYPPVARREAPLLGSAARRATSGRGVPQWLFGRQPTTRSFASCLIFAGTTSVSSSA
jgi:hypothetical protein